MIGWGWGWAVGVGIVVAGGGGAVEHGLELIRGCQLPDGVIRMRAEGEAVWVVPYCGNFAAMALVAGGEAGDLERAERWLLWYAARQHVDGTIDDHEGTVRAYRSSGRCDSTDAYAATYLMAARRYQAARGGELRGEVVAAARRALGAIEAVAQGDGLTYARPDYPMKYLMDNVEVAGGLAEGAALFQAAGLGAEAERARRLGARVAGALPRFWSERDACYAVAIDEAGVLTVGLDRSYPDGLAQLYAMAHLGPPRRGLWTRVRATFRPGEEGVPVERWLMAARRVAPAVEVRDLEGRTRGELLGFTPTSVYVDRPALAILALIDGAARLPDAGAPAGR